MSGVYRVECAVWEGAVCDAMCGVSYGVWCAVCGVWCAVCDMVVCVCSV